MRFGFLSFLILLVMSAPAVAQHLVTPERKPNKGSNYASPNLIPAKKPERGNFSNRSPNMINAQSHRDIQSRVLSAQKPAVTSTTTKSGSDLTMVNGIPIPPRKPVNVNKIQGYAREYSLGTLKRPAPNRQARQQPQQQKSFDEKVLIPYSGSGVSDRMAGTVPYEDDSNNNDYNRRNEVVSLPPQPRLTTAAKDPGREDQGRDRQPAVVEKTTDGNSPFQTASLPRANDSSSQEPVIVFFVEQSSDLEVGQTEIIESDILRAMKKRSGKKAFIYGYADESEGKNDRAQNLSMSRAMILAQYLADQGMPKDRIMIRAMGNDTPISPKNRVDVIVE